MSDVNRPAYYAVIPSSVRYCDELKFAERLLYGEITALTNKEGYCFATNKYFSELYGVIPGTISRWISHLEKLGFIETEIIKDEKNQILERRIYINDNYREIIANTYKQNKQYPYEQNCLYPISRKAKDNNINIRIDRFFNFIIKKEKANPENMTDDETSKFLEILTKLEFNYTEDLLKIFTKENIEKLKISIFALKELFMSNKRKLITKINRIKLLTIYDNCKTKEIEYQNTDKEIKNFFEYYYISLTRELEKS